MRAIIAIATGVAFTILLFSCAATAHAKGARASVSSSSFSSSKPVSSYTSTRSTVRSTRTTRPNTRAPIYTKIRKDDDVECSTLRHSKYREDRAVYRRYC